MGETIFEKDEEIGAWMIPKGKWVCPFAINGSLLVDKPIEVGDEQVLKFIEIVRKEKRIPTDYLLSMKVSIPEIIEKRMKQRIRHHRLLN